jgi:ADP-ribose pyrophosphatase YjhB (NUDIX family)
MDASEVPLVGGNVSSVVRVGDTVHRSIGRWTESVQGLLRYLEEQEIEGVPRVLGFDEKGREVLTYLDGTVPNEEPWPAYVWSERTLVDVGHWLRRYHRAVEGYRPDDSARWWYRDGAPREGEIVCHNDLAPYNTVFVEERVAGIIDWDIAGPARPAWDLAFCAWSWVPLHHPDLTRSLGGPGEDAQAARLRALCAAYGAGDPSTLLPTVIERVAASREAIEAGVVAGAEAMRALASAGHLEDMERTLGYLEDRTPELWRELGAKVVERESARVAILDEADRILLMSTRDPDDGLVVWFLPGGTLKPDETIEEAAYRELAEEVDGSARFDLVGPVWRRRHLHTFASRKISLREHYFMARVDASGIEGAYETGEGGRYFHGWRWWSLEELVGFDGIVAPRRLAELLPAVIAGDIPDEPVDTGI